MRAFIQRVSEAQVSVDGTVRGRIGLGLLVLLGVTHDDGQVQVEYLVRKITQLRIFRDDEGKMNRSLLDCGGALLVVSQFTLYADTSRGRRPGFDQAAHPTQAKALYQRFVDYAATVAPVQTGVFGATMEVQLINDGPVSIMLETPA